MINPKQRAYLKSLAHEMKPLVQLGKDGISDKFVAGIMETLELHELVKVSVLENAGITAGDAAKEVCEKTGADFVQSIGRRFVIYKMRSKDPTIILTDSVIKGKARTTGRRNDSKTALETDEKPISKRSRLEAKKEIKKPLAKKPKIRSIAKQKAKKAKG